MTAYVVVESDWDSDYILGIYTSRAAADEHCTTNCLLTPNRPGHLTEVQEHEIRTRYVLTADRNGVGA